MNIFYLDHDPVICAQSHCDAHSSKMCVEYAQLLSTAHRVLDGELWWGISPKGRRVKRYILPDPEMNYNVYKACHENHPSNIWVRESANNYQWLYQMWTNLCREYTHRYDRNHESYVKLKHYLMTVPANISKKAFTQPTPAMKQYPECVVEGDSIQSYRNFYWADKRKFARWTKREKPQWWLEYERKGV